MSPYCPTCRDGIVIYSADSGYRCFQCGRCCRPLFHRAHKVVCAVLVLALPASVGLAAVGAMRPSDAAAAAVTAFIVLLATLAHWLTAFFSFNEGSVRARWHMQVSWMERMIADLGHEKAMLEIKVSELKNDLEDSAAEKARLAAENAMLRMDNWRLSPPPPANPNAWRGSIILD